MTDNALASNADVPVYVTPGTSAARTVAEAGVPRHVLGTSAAEHPAGEASVYVLVLERQTNDLPAQVIAVDTRSLEGRQGQHAVMAQYPSTYTTRGENPDHDLIDSLSIPRQNVQGQNTITEPTLYKMRAWNLTLSAYEFWVATGGPNTLNPSGQPILAGSLTVVAVKRPKDLVGQGPS
jgi:hypothetical protein